MAGVRTITLLQPLLLDRRVTLILADAPALPERNTLKRRPS